MSELKSKVEVKNQMNKNAMSELLNVMSALRDPSTGCVWDKQQTYKSILPHTIEEVYEVAEAIERENFDELLDELGDLLFQIVFYAQIAKEEGRFDFDDIASTITQKMIRRHPHVFADTKIETVEQQSKLWDEIKQQEKSADKADTQASVKNFMDSVNQHQPAIAVANKLQKKAATVGFDWPSLQGPLDKIDEEVEEVKEAIQSGDANHIKDELGDLFFATVNLARHLKIDPEAAIRSTNRKFVNRYRAMEIAAIQNNEIFSELSLERMEEYWQIVKKSQMANAT